MIDIKQLQYFIISAEQGSFSEAAVRLYTTQPHVSMVVKSLEKELGMALFQRDPKGVSLTEDGERIYAYAKNILKNAELIEMAGKQKSRQQFSVAANPSSNLKEIYAGYMKEKKTEGCRFLYKEGGVEQVMSMVEAHEVELGFMFVPVEKKTAFTSLIERKRLEFIPLVHSQLMLYAGQNSPLYGKTSIPVSQLGELQYVQLEEDYFTLEDLPAAFLKGFFTGMGLDRVVVTNSSDMVLRLLRETDLCNLSSFWTRTETMKKEISQIRIEGYNELVIFGCLKRKNDGLSQYAEEFLRRLRQIASAQSIE